MAELILIRGLPGSGKTTLAKGKYVPEGFLHYEADQFFETEYGYKFNPTKLREAHAHCLTQAATALLSGYNCVVSNTFSRKWEMEPYIKIAKSLGVSIKIIETKGNWKNCHNVPEEVINNMRLRWEPCPEF